MPYRKVSQKTLCPICGKPDWCMISTDGEMVICGRVSEGALRTLKGGHLHRIKESDKSDRAKRGFVPRNPSADCRPKINALKITMLCCRRVKKNALHELSVRLNVSEIALRFLMVGWHDELQAWTFPMRDGNMKIIGIRTRLRDDQKRSVYGSRAGLFIPVGRQPSGTLFIVEGPTDTAAMMTCGCAVIGRPSCLGSEDQIRTYCRKQARSRSVVIVADNDGPGEDGAYQLRRSLGFGHVSAPPPHVKDVREMISAMGYHGADHIRGQLV